MPEYMHVGNKILIGKGLKAKQFLGPIVASRQAFFAHLGAGELTTALGIVGALAESVLKQTSQPMETDLSNLPPDIAEHPDWPIKRKKGRLIVLPRPTVKNIKYSFWTTYDLTTDQQIYRIELKWLTRKRILRFLRESGWE